MRVRIYQWLGYRRANASRKQPEWAGLDSGYNESRVWFPLSWPDRLRILWSGKIEVDIIHVVEPMPRRWESTADLAALPPNYRGD